MDILQIIYIFILIQLKIYIRFSQQHMTDKTCANKAIAQLDGYCIDNSNIRVEVVELLFWNFLFYISLRLIISLLKYAF